MPRRRGLRRVVLNQNEVKEPQAPNTPGAPDKSGDIAAELKRTVNALKAESFDTDAGRVDYTRVRTAASYAEFRAATANLVHFDPAALPSRDDRLAFWINLYNVLLVDAVIVFHVQRSVKEVWGLFRRASYCIGGMVFSANDIEHGILRGNAGHPASPVRQFRGNDARRSLVIEPPDVRIHFALVCASASCPPIGVYDAGMIDTQLDNAAASFINGGEVAVDERADTVALSRIFLWYKQDFGGRDGLLDIIIRYLDDGPAKEHMQAHRDNVRLTYKPYDWSLNH